MTIAKVLVGLPSSTEIFKGESLAGAPAGVITGPSRALLLLVFTKPLLLPKGTTRVQSSYLTMGVGIKPN